MSMSQTYAQLRLDLASALAAFLDPLEAHAEAMRWFEEGLGRGRTWLLAHGEEPVPDEERKLVGSWIRRRREGEPWAYILGWTTFREHRFEVNWDTLIPRPETELVLEAALEMGQRLHVNRVCDVGTGSGILAVCLALETDWAVSATDLSEKALGIAQRNAEAHGAAVTFHLGDLLAPVPDPLGLVVSNPPYVDPADRPSLQRELRFEPDLALYAEDRGLAIATELLGQAKRRSARGCVLEIGAGQGEALRTRGLRLGWKRIVIHQDLAGHDRVLMAVG
jgi:release factor glutamine methyltransferase